MDEKELDKEKDKDMENYTLELKRALSKVLIETIVDFPAKKIKTEHFVLNVIDSKSSLAFLPISRICTVSEIELLYNHISDSLHSETSSNTTHLNGKKIPYDDELTKHLENADNERKKLLDPKINSEHVFLSILSIDGKCKKLLNDKSITYDKYLSEINKMKSNNVSTFTGAFTDMLMNGSKSNALKSYCLNLNDDLKTYGQENLIGREKDVDRIINALGRKNKNNILIIGQSGVGKTTVVKGLVDLINKNNASFLNGKSVFYLNIPAILAGATYKGIVEDRLNNVFLELVKKQNCILVIDDLHYLISNNSGGNQDVIGVLIKGLNLNTVNVIATTNFKELKSIDVNQSLMRNFQTLKLEISSLDESIQILLGKKHVYEKYHNVKYTEDVITLSVKLADKYLKNKTLPDSAFDIIDECGSIKKKNNLFENEIITELSNEIRKYEIMRDKSMKYNDFKLGDEYNKKAKEYKSRLIDEQKKIKKEEILISEDDIYNTVSEITGIDINKLSVNDKEKYLNIQNTLKKHIIGQDEAIEKISQSIKRSRIGLNRKNKPNGVYLCVGESGVGKTLLAKKIAEEIYGSEKMMIRLDMSEYADKTSLNKLIGSGAGYIGYEAGGILTESVKNKSHGVLLLDEIEKADKDILNMFLQVFDDGVLTDNTGHKVYFDNLIIIMTSNIGAKEAQSFAKSAGFISNDSENKKNISEKAIKKHFPPEFLNRVDDILFFNKLNDDDLGKIVKIELEKMVKAFKDIEKKVTYDENIMQILVDKIKEVNISGARSVTKVIQKEIENKICDLYLENDYNDDKIFNIVINNENKIIIE